VGAVTEAFRLSDKELQTLIKPLWLGARPTVQAQSIRAELSNAFDDPRCQTWASDQIPDYVWDLIDIAAQRGIELGAKAA
jgi:hypothetical protein